MQASAPATWARAGGGATHLPTKATQLIGQPLPHFWGLQRRRGRRAPVKRSCIELAHRAAPGVTNDEAPKKRIQAGARDTRIAVNAMVTPKRNHRRTNHETPILRAGRTSPPTVAGKRGRHDFAFTSQPGAATSPQTRRRPRARWPRRCAGRRRARAHAHPVTALWSHAIYILSAVLAVPSSALRLGPGLPLERGGATRARRGTRGRVNPAGVPASGLPPSCSFCLRRDAPTALGTTPETGARTKHVAPLSLPPSALPAPRQSVMGPSERVGDNAKSS